MFRLFNVAQRVCGSKCTAPAKSASASYVVPADVTSAAHHTSPREYESYSENLEFCRSSDEIRRAQEQVWKWGVEIGGGHIAVTRTRGGHRGGRGWWKGGCHWRGEGDRHGGGCEQEWHERWRACRHDMWSSCHKTWHFLEAVGWGTVAVVGYQISDKQRKEERCARVEHQCIVRRLCAALSSVLSHPWYHDGSAAQNSLFTRYMLPHVHSQHAITGEKECVRNEVASQSCVSVDGQAAGHTIKKSYAWHDFYEQTSGFKFDKFNFVPKSSHVEQSSTIDITSPVDSAVKSPSIDALMSEIVSDWQRLAREYCSSLDNTAAVSKAKRGCLEEAVASWLKIVEETDNSKALFNLALSYEQGLGTVRDISKAVEYYERAAEKGNPKAAFNLAMIIVRENYSQRLDEVKQLLKLAASHGLPEAQRELAVLYTEDGPANMTEAVSLFKQAAEKNDVHSCYNLAVCYEEGLGVDSDEIKAVELYERAALMGHAEALYNLATYHESGRAGLAVDKEKALMLYQSAVSGGNKEAVECVARLESELSQNINKSTSLPVNTNEDAQQFLQVPTIMTRSGSSSVTFSRLLSTGSDASDLSSSYNEDDSDGWESDGLDAIKSESGNETSSAKRTDSKADKGMMMFGKKSSLRTGFFLGFSDDEEGIGSELEMF